MYSEPLNQDPLMARSTQPMIGDSAGPLVGTGMPDLSDLLGAQPGTAEPIAGPVERPATAARDFLSFFGLDSNPFSDSVNPTFFYRTDSHDVAFIRMMMAVEHHMSLGLVTGPSGTGKTMVSQMMLTNLDPEKYETILVLVSPNMGKTALLREILGELDIEVADAQATTQAMLKQLSRRIIDLYENNRTLVILLDECHFLSAESLHLIRTISNIEIPERKLSTCILFAEKRFLKRLDNPSYESLRNRMYLRSELGPLELQDVDQYIKYRLLVSGCDESPFDDAAVVSLHAASGGICRQVNRLCMLALLEAFSRGVTRINEGLIAVVAGKT